MATCSDPTPAGLIAGIERFNAREFYECHEFLEDIWLAEPGEIRTLYQGILQVGVAFYHLSRDNIRGTTSLLETGTAYLRRFRPECMGVNVDKLIRDSLAAYDEINRIGRERLSEFDPGLIPVIEMGAGGPS